MANFEFEPALLSYDYADPANGPSLEHLAGPFGLSSFHPGRTSVVPGFHSLFSDSPQPTDRSSAVPPLDTNATPDSESQSPSSPVIATNNVDPNFSDSTRTSRGGNPDIFLPVGEFTAGGEKRKASVAKVDEKGASKSLKSEPKKASGKKESKKDSKERLSKRKEQNRAAQKSFRDRKEKHLKDLEDRISELENETSTTTSENEFLKQQVDKLQSELKKFRGNRGSISSASSSAAPSKPFTFEFPFVQANKSPVSTTSSVSNQSEYMSPSESVLSLSHFGSMSSISSTKSAQLDKDVLNLSSSTAQVSPHNSTSSELLAHKPSYPKTSPPSFEPDFFAEYRDSMFNVEDLVLPDLTTEPSVFDPLDSIFQDFDRQVYDETLPTLQISSGFDIPEDELVLPNQKTQYISGNAIWDRISTHPRFGEVDIDGLCFELRTKAKCTDGTVVMSKEEMDKVIARMC